MSIASKSFVIMFFCLVPIGIYDTIEMFNYSNHPDDNQIIKAGNYSIKLSKQGIEQFKKEINDKFCNKKNDSDNSYKYYNDSINAIKNFTKIIKMIGNEITEKKYSRSDVKIKEIAKIFSDVLDKIKSTLDKSGLIYGNYRTKNIDAIFSKAQYEILKSFTYTFYIIEIIIMIMLLILVVILEYKSK